MSVYQELGTKLKNFMLGKTEEVDDKIEAIDKHERYVNTDLDYGVFEVNTMRIGAGTPLVFSNIVSGSMTLSENGFIKLQKSKTYVFHINLYSTPYNCGMFLVDKELNQLAEAITSANGSFIYQALEDIEVTFVPEQNVAPDISDTWSCVNVYEINRQIVIDPVEHVNDSQGIEDTPVGHIIAHMGTVAPKHYLICDGTEYNIADYPYLAQHIEDNFGSINFFGGDGEITFAVPDLRGEFLRGTGTNGHENSGKGANVGIHQDSTTIIPYHVYPEAKRFTARYDDGKLDNSKGSSMIANADSSFPVIGKMGNLTLENGVTSSTTVTFSQAIRPTNTSVLYCIKYEPTYFMNTYNTNYMQPSLYSEEERVVGCWIDGKPIYQKTLILDDTLVTHVNWYYKAFTELGINNIDTPINAFGYMIATNSDSEFIYYNHFSSSAWYSTIQCSKTHLKIVNIGFIGISYITVQYTKTTDEENSFTNDMLKDSYVELTYTDEEISTMVSDILGGEE